MKFSQMFKAEDGRNYAFVFALVCTLFFLWALCNGMIDVLNKHFQNTLHISKAQSAFVQFSNYMGYFLMALPAGLLAKRFGYKAVIILGLLLIAAGAFWFIPATGINTFPAFMVGLFIIATGMTCLETVANPYTTILGPAEMGASRINLAQSCNGIGWIFGPLIGGQIILSATKEVNTSNSTLYIPYMIIGAVVVVIAVAFIFTKIPEIKAEEEVKVEGASTSTKSMWKRKHFTLAVVSQFLYVAAQTGIFSFFINYFVENSGVADRTASNWLTVGFVLFLLGRLSGSMIMRSTKAHSTLAVFSFANVALMVVTMLVHGKVGAGALLMSFFFMSIMFPTIFALGIRGLGEQTKQASSFIVMANVGGAQVTMLMGRIADVASMRVGFIVPLICFIFVGAYAAFWQKLEAKDAAV
jgi:FHS family L-fucose permease-like MFS transporter